MFCKKYIMFCKKYNQEKSISDCEKCFLSNNAGFTNITNCMNYNLIKRSIQPMPDLKKTPIFKMNYTEEKKTIVVSFPEDVANKLMDCYEKENSNLSFDNFIIKKLTEIC